MCRHCRKIAEINVFSLCQKITREVAVVMSSGSEFHNLASMTGKTETCRKILPYVTEFRTSNFFVITTAMIAKCLISALLQCRHRERWMVSRRNNDVVRRVINYASTRVKDGDEIKESKWKTDAIDAFLDVEGHVTLRHTTADSVVVS